MKIIIICPDHEKPIPMISTFAFIGAEMWCPYCGHTCGLPFHDGIEVEITPELEEIKREWTEKSKDFLNAKSSMVCSSLLWEGKRIKPSELPEEEQARLKKIINDWEYDGM